MKEWIKKDRKTEKLERKEGRMQKRSEETFERRLGIEIKGKEEKN